MQEKIYIGTAKEIITQYGSKINLSFSPKDLEALKDNKNEKGWINLTISPRKSVWKYWETHSCVVNDWKPENKQEPKITIEDIPF